MGTIITGFKGVFIYLFLLPPPSPVASLSHGFPPVSTDPNDIHFNLFNSPARPFHTQEIRILNSSSLEESGFIPNVVTVIFVHGYQTKDFRPDGGSAVTTAYLNSGIRGNYLAVDWGKLNTPQFDMGVAALPALVPEFVLGYAEVVQNMPLVSERLSLFLDWLLEEGVISLDKVHLIGFSLGAHVVGGAGAKVQELRNGERVRRITGLDPAGPLLEFPIKLEKTLDREDGNFVDIIHTSVGLYGTIERAGDVDFYVNNGIVQPACLGPIVVDCSHYYALAIYAESFTGGLIGCECPPWKWLKGSCHTPCIHPTRVGLYCPETVRGIYHLNYKPHRYHVS